MVIIESLSFSQANVSNLRTWGVFVLSAGSNSTLCPAVEGNIALSLFIYLGFYVAFNTVQVISRWVVGRAKETSTYSSLGF